MLDATALPMDRFFILSLDLLCIAGTDGYFKQLNPAFSRTLGYTTDELLARPFLDFVHPDDRAATLAEMEKLSRGAPTLHFENRYRCRDGAWKWLSWKVHPFPDEGLLYATARDVTEGKRIEEQTAAHIQALAEFKAALDQHAIVAITDPRGRITYVNDKFCAISRYPRAELLGQDHRIINSGHHPQAFMRDLWQTIRGGRVWRGEICNRAKDGSFYWVDSTIVPFLDEHGQPVQYIAIRAEITARKEAEAAIQRLNADLHRRAAQLTEANQMGQLIDDLLDFSGLSRSELGETRVHLDDLVRNVVAGQPTGAQGRNIAWQIGPLPQVVADPSLLRQALGNLIGNAVKYTRPRDPARIEIGCAGEEAGRIVVFVRDNGAGFDMKYVHKLFGVFQRLHRTDEFEGTGIGLAIVRRVIARHGGRVWAEGTPGEGATFYFTLKPAATT